MMEAEGIFVVDLETGEIEDVTDLYRQAGHFKGWQLHSALFNYLNESPLFTKRDPESKV